MGTFFSGATGKQVEVNKRGIMAEIEIDNSAYQGKKVSRADLMENEDEVEESDEGEEGEEEAGEEGESQYDESSSESVQGDLLKADGVSDDSQDEEAQRNRKLLNQL